MGMVFDIRRYAIHDGPGIRTTVFLKGCPLDCWWCHNPESQSSQPELIFRENRCIGCEACVAECRNEAISFQRSAFGGQRSTANGLPPPVTNRTLCQVCGECAEVCYAEAREIAGREMTVAQVLAEIVSDIPFYDESGGGVTFSGGEPLLQREFLLELLRACKTREIHTTVDTSGFTAWPVIESIRPYTDLFLYDLKLMDDEKHRRYTGVSNALILSNLRKLSKAGQAITIRIPIVPGINDDEDNIRRTGEFLTCLPHRHPVELLPYHASADGKYSGLGKVNRLPGTVAPSGERMQMIAERLRSFGLQVK